MHTAFAAFVVASWLCCASGAQAGGAAPLEAPPPTASAAQPAAGTPPDPAASAAIQALEQRIERLRQAQEAAQRDIAAAQARVRELQARARDPLPYVLAALVLLLLAAVVLLLWRLARLRAEQAWQRDAQSLTALEPTAPPDIERMTRGPPGFDEVTATSMRVVDDASGDTVPPAPLTVPGVGPSTPAFVAAARSRRELTADEHFDLEQQADFFIAIGQEEAAVDLLMALARSSGGASPAPYLKLLAIHRRRGDASSYERVRERFNRRFNAQAPEWSGAGAGGRPLEDYPEVFERVQRAWAEPVRAVDLLEALLFRRDPAQAGFELPAYEELLCLHAVARDLRNEARDPQEVDLLLPLDPHDAPPAITPVGSPKAPPAGRGVDVDLDLGAPPPPRREP